MADTTKTNALKKYSKDSSGKVYGLKGKDKEHERQINSPRAKLKRAYRQDRDDEHTNRFVDRDLARLNRGKSSVWDKIGSRN